MVAKKKKSRKPTRRPRRAARVVADKVSPTKIVPGVMGRTKWFVERAGYKKDALSLRRLLGGLDTAERMAEASVAPDSLADDADALLRRARLLGKKLRAPVFIDTNGRARDVKTRRFRKREGLTALAYPVEVPQPRGAWGLLVIPVPEKTTRYLDLSEVIGADYTNRGNPRLLSSFRYLPNEGVVVGRVDRAGMVQAFAYPRHAWLRLAFDTICRYWKYIALDPIVRKAAGAKVKNQPAIIDRLCRVILCPPDYLAVDDPHVFDHGGIAFPPGYGAGGEFGDPIDPGIPPGLDGVDGNICDRCIGGFLGEIDIFDGMIIMPPLIKWCWIMRPRCSRWRSIGPVPGTGFGGIGRVTQLAIHPTLINTLIAAAAGGGVWRTDNGGNTWYPKMELQPTLTMGAVAMAPSNGQIMYAASGEDADGWGPAWGGIGVYRSADGGAHWTIATGVPSTLFSAIVVHPTDPNVIYVAGDTGLHKSSDGGATWITNPGLGSLLDGSVTDVVIAHDDADRLYVGLRNDGVYQTTTGGVASGATPAFTRLDAAGQLPSAGSAGWIKLAIGRSGAHGSDCVVAKMGANGDRIFRTLDAGATWTELASGVASVSFDEWCSVIAVDPEDEDVMYAGAAGAMQRTTNGGAALGDWTSISAGLHADQQDLVFDPADSDRIFHANDGGVYRSSNRGTTWEFASGNLAITQLYDIDIAERDRDIVAGGAQDNGVYYRDAAAVWHHIPWGDGTQVAIDPTDPAIFYFSSQNGLPTFIRKSIDGGASHQQIGQTGLSGSSPWVTIIKLDPTDPIAAPATNRTLFVCGFSTLFRSTDGGQNWQRVDDALGNAFTTVGTITALEFAPSDTSILY
ncbi:MAG: WD40/YVTN/BNR-like repeat-containing protein, partial [Gemmatimonadaceae bacterium]